MVYPLRGGQVSIGRGPDNTIQLIDSRISREHVVLKRRRNGWWLEDLQSKNGTTVNSDVILDPIRLASGDVLHVGNIRLIFENELAHAVESDPSHEGSSVRFSTGDSGLSARHRVEVQDTARTSIDVVPEDADARLHSIYQVGQIIQSTLDLDEMLEKLMGIIVRVLNPTHAVIFIRDTDAGALVPRSVHRPEGSDEQATVSRSILEQSIEESVGILMGDAREDKRFQDAESVVGGRIESALCVPLISKGDVLGAIYLDLRAEGRGYRQNDLQWLVGVAAQAALAINVAMLHNESLERRQRERDLEIARSIQMNLLPRGMPSLPGFDFSGMSRPALMVGGDWYDAAALDGDKAVLAIADVSGKGIPAAILVASVRSAVRLEARSLPSEDLVSVVTRLNEAVCEETTSSMFVTMVLGVLDASTRRFHFCNAGHAHPVLRTADGEITHLEAGGCFLGIDPELKIEAGAVQLDPGSLLVLYTDGVTDALNGAGEAFGQERLMDYIQKHHDNSASAFVEGLDAAVREFQGDAEAFDDFTVLVVRAE